MLLSQQELYQLAQTSNSEYAYCYDTNQRQADAKRRIYAHTYQQWMILHDAMTEGVFEITVRSRTQTLTLNLTSSSALQLMNELQQQQGNILHELEQDIIYHEVAKAEDQEDREGTSNRAKIWTLCQPTDE